MSKLFALLVAVAVLLALATNGPAANRASSFDVVLPKTNSKYVDIGRKGYSPGDYFLATGPILDKVGGERIGGLAGVWTLVSPKGDDAAIVLHLERGTVHVDGRINHRKAPSVLRLLGGTGAYKGVRGTATFRYLTETSATLHIALG